MLDNFGIKNYNKLDYSDLQSNKKKLILPFSIVKFVEYQNSQTRLFDLLDQMKIKKKLKTQKSLKELKKFF